MSFSRLCVATLLTLAVCVIAAPKTHHQPCHHQQHQQQHVGSSAVSHQPADLVNVELLNSKLAPVALARNDKEPHLSSRLFGRHAAHYKVEDDSMSAQQYLVANVVNHEPEADLVELDILRRHPVSTTGDTLQPLPETRGANSPPLPGMVQRRYTTTGDFIQPPPGVGLLPLPFASGLHSRQFITSGDNVREEPRRDNKKSRPKPKQRQVKKPAPKGQHAKSKSGQFGAKAVEEPENAPTPTATTTSNIDSSSTGSTSTMPSLTPDSAETALAPLPTDSPLVNFNLALQHPTPRWFRGDPKLVLRHDVERHGAFAAAAHPSTNDNGNTTTTSTTTSSHSGGATPTDAVYDSSGLDNGGFFLHGLRQGAVHMSGVFGDSQADKAASSAASPDDPQSSDSTDGSTSPTPTCTDAAGGTTTCTDDSSTSASSTATPTALAAAHNGNMINLDLKIQRRELPLTPPVLVPVGVPVDLKQLSTQPLPIGPNSVKGALPLSPPVDTDDVKNSQLPVSSFVDVVKSKLPISSPVDTLQGKLPAHVGMNTIESAKTPVGVQTVKDATLPVTPPVNVQLVQDAVEKTPLGQESDPESVDAHAANSGGRPPHSPAPNSSTTASFDAEATAPTTANKPSVAANTDSPVGLVQAVVQGALQPVVQAVQPVTAAAQGAKERRPTVQDPQADVALEKLHATDNLTPWIAPAKIVDGLLAREEESEPELK